MFTDRELSCCDCKASFTFTAAEQQFFEQMSFGHPPRRCKPCRKARKAASGEGGGAAGRGAGSRDSAAKRARPTRVMHPANCSECGAETSVPFEPDPARATFCPDCFRRRRPAPTA